MCMLTSLRTSTTEFYRLVKSWTEAEVSVFTELWRKRSETNIDHFNCQCGHRSPRPHAGLRSICTWRHLTGALMWKCHTGDMLRISFSPFLKAWWVRADIVEESQWSAFDLPSSLHACGLVSHAPFILHCEAHTYSRCSAASSSLDWSISYTEFTHNRLSQMQRRKEALWNPKIRLDTKPQSLSVQWGYVTNMADFIATQLSKKVPFISHLLLVRTQHYKVTAWYPIRACWIRSNALRRFSSSVMCSVLHVLSCLWFSIWYR